MFPLGWIALKNGKDKIAYLARTCSATTKPKQASLRIQCFFLCSDAQIARFIMRVENNQTMFICRILVMETVMDESQTQFDGIIADSQPTPTVRSPVFLDSPVIGGEAKPGQR